MSLFKDGRLIVTETIDSPYLPPIHPSKDWSQLLEVSGWTWVYTFTRPSGSLWHRFLCWIGKRKPTHWVVQSWFSYEEPKETSCPRK